MASHFPPQLFTHLAPIGKHLALIHRREATVLDDDFALADHRFHMAGIQPKYEVGRKVVRSDLGGGIVVENDQTVVPIPACPAGLELAVHITETPVDVIKSDALGGLARQEGGLGAAQHVAVHAVGAQHDVVG